MAEMGKNVLKNWRGQKGKKIPQIICQQSYRICKSILLCQPLICAFVL